MPFGCGLYQSSRRWPAQIGAGQRGLVIIEQMVIDMQEAQVCTLIVAETARYRELAKTMPLIEK